MALCRRHTSYSRVSDFVKLFWRSAFAAFPLFSERIQRATTYLVVATVCLSGPIQAQVPPEDHQAHHPGAAAPPQQLTPDSPNVGISTGLMEGMGEMMRQMGAPPPEQIYPSLMTLPDLPPEKRAEVEAAAHERMVSGTALMTDGLTRLADSISPGDYNVMQQAISLLHEGMARYESGLAAHRVLVGTSDPQAIALDWFRREMALPVPSPPPVNTSMLGVTWFHFWIMLSSAVLIAGFLGLYVLKMRRTAQLLNSLTTLTGDQHQPLAPRAPSPSNPSKPAPATTLGRPWSGQLRVGRIFQETSDVKTFRLVNPAGGMLPFEYLPGQFITVTVPNGESTARRSYTIASSPTQRDYIEVTVKHAPGGVVSGYLHSAVDAGNLLDLSGPAGSFVFTGRECKCILLIAAGVGITPLMSVLRYLLDSSWSGDVFLVYGCRTPEDIIFREELDYLNRRHANLQVVITLSEVKEAEWPGSRGRITKDLLAASVPDLPSRYAHICGPVPMMEATKKILAEVAIPADRIKTEAFGPALGKQERPPDIARKTEQNSNLPTVTFTDSDRKGPLPTGRVVLDVAEELGVDIDYSCRAGVCGVCRVQLLSGEVSMDVEDGLEPGDKERNLILACQAKATCDILVKA